MAGQQQDVVQRPVDGQTVLINVGGEVGRLRALSIQRALDDAVRRGRLRAVVDLSAATAVQPGVLAALLHARRRLLARGGELTVVAPKGLLGAGHVLPTVPTLEDAGVLPPFGHTARAVADAVGPLRRALTQWAARAGANAYTQDSIALAASEAITNAVVHAYRKCAPGDVTVTGELLDLDRIRVVVTDDGSGMVPRPDSPGLGLGLPLVAQITRDVSIDSGPGRGTRVAMEFGLLSGC